MKKLLITGASGFLGWNLCDVAKSEWDVIGTYRTNASDVSGCTYVRLDATDYGALKASIVEIKPDVVIHVAAISDINYCQKNRVEARKINVDASANLAGLCADRSIPFLFTSSDLVFDGRHPPYDEESAVCPVSAYGEQKVMAEAEITDRCPTSVICRMPLMFGDAGPGARSFLQPLIAGLESGQEVPLFTDEYRTPLSGRSAAEGLLLAMVWPGGILHLGGSERISRFEFAQLVVKVGAFEKANLRPCRQSDVITSAPRPPDVSLNSARAGEIGFRPLPILNELERLACLSSQRADDQEPTN